MIERKVVIVREVLGDLAFVEDDFGGRLRVPTTVERTHRRPRQGENWVIDRALGGWTFAARLAPTDDDAEPLRSWQREGKTYEVRLTGVEDVYASGLGLRLYEDDVEVAVWIPTTHHPRPA
jgi:hypothetical protein